MNFRVAVVVVLGEISVWTTTSTATYPKQTMHQKIRRLNEEVEEGAW